MERNDVFVDLLADRRDKSDFLWVSRATEPLVPHPLPPVANYSRSQAIEAALSNPKVVLTIESLAAARNVDRSVVVKEARAMLEEMASKADLPTVRWIGLLVVKALKRLLLSFRVNQKFLLQLRIQMKDSQVQYVYAPTHRSYLDFVLMSYILFSHDMALPNIASGMDFYRMQIVGELLRKTGAFYMRRSFSTDQLYKEIFRAYVSSIVTHSDRAIEFFIEGTRSRSQKSLAPKYGLLAMILEGLFQGEVPDIQIVPISITYDRPLEESLFSYELLGEPKPAETTTGLFRSLSILREPQAHGHVHFNIATPISAREYVDSTTRKMAALSPNAKLPSEIVTRLAYAIIDTHKTNTVITPFNLIAVLYNERVHSYPQNPYTIDTLIEDYRWFRKIMIDSFGAIVSPHSEDSGVHIGEQPDFDDITESLNVHKDLLSFDDENFLVLKERHRDGQTNKKRIVKGHLLESRTMAIAVSVVNLSIYVNPTFALLAKPCMCALSIHRAGITRDQAFEQYFLLRSLLSTEFAIPSDIDKSVADLEWNENLSLLAKEDCLNVTNDRIVPGINTRLYNLLRNLVSPYAAAVYIVCKVLSRWDDTSMGPIIEKQVLKESQKKAEYLLFEEESLIQHPYTLSLDLYQSTLVSLTSFGVIKTSGTSAIYETNDITLENIINDLEKMLVQRSPGSYLNVMLQSSQQYDNTLQAKFKKLQLYMMRRLDAKETWGAERLEAELEAARDGLRGLDRDIRKILGRDLPDGENPSAQPSPRLSQKRPLQEDRKRGGLDFGNNDQSGGKRRWQAPAVEPKTVFSRLSARVPSNPDDSGDDDDGNVKPAVPSRVIATPREIPSRQEVIRRERDDERSRQRNKRMFGALLGTLQKFRQEETKLKAKEDKKAEVEARVEEARKKEKEELRRERQQLFLSRKRQLVEVRNLEAKLARSKQFQQWRDSQLPLASFIRTRAQPAIYYLPKRKHPQTDALLEQCSKELHQEVERREKAMAKEIELIDSQMNYGKHQQQFDGAMGSNETEEVPHLVMEEGEENRDPNPEPNITIDLLIKSEQTTEIVAKLEPDDVPLPVDTSVNAESIMVEKAEPEVNEVDQENEAEEANEAEDENDVEEEERAREEENID